MYWYQGLPYEDFSTTLFISEDKFEKTEDNGEKYTAGNY